eukprot:2521979-Amphidinium_carterae.1
MYFWRFDPASFPGDTTDVPASGAEDDASESRVLLEYSACQKDISLAQRLSTIVSLKAKLFVA